MSLGRIGPKIFPYNEKEFLRPLNVILFQIQTMDRHENTGFLALGQALNWLNFLNCKRIFLSTSKYFTHNFSRSFFLPLDD